MNRAVVGIAAAGSLCNVLITGGLMYAAISTYIFRRSQIYDEGNLRYLAEQAILGTVALLVGLLLSWLAFMLARSAAPLRTSLLAILLAAVPEAVAFGVGYAIASAGGGIYGLFLLAAMTALVGAIAWWGAWRLAGPRPVAT